VNILNYVAILRVRGNSEGTWLYWVYVTMLRVHDYIEVT